MPHTLEMRGITKRFPGVLANDHVDFSLAPGETHALLGENGAGKSTLMNILYGLYRPDEGEIMLDGRSIHIKNPSSAIRFGIGMVHQHFMLVPVMSVAENMIIGNEMTRWGMLLDLKRAARKISELSHQYGLEIDPDTLVGNLPVGIRQRVEILKALYRDADILILDEPTAVLTPEEIQSLFQTITSLADQGKSIIFITHKLKEVMQIADRITVLRNGKVVGVSTPQETSEAELASLMVGREVSLTIDKKPSSPGDVILGVQDLEVADQQGVAVVSKVSFDIREGEILGIAGVHGNGQVELVKALTGLQKCVSGKIGIAGIDVTNASPRTILESGVAHIPEDRHEYGMVEAFPITYNLILSSYYQSPFSRRLMFNHNAVAENAERLIRSFDIRTPDMYTPAGSLSGGNQQKMVIAREFSRPIRLLIAANPTRGLDVGSAEFIQRSLIEKRDQGCAILLISAELDEIFALSDRIAVIYKGTIIATIGAADADRKTIGLWMAGVDTGSRVQI